MFLIFFQILIMICIVDALQVKYFLIEISKTNANEFSIFEMRHQWIFLAIMIIYFDVNWNFSKLY